MRIQLFTFMRIRFELVIKFIMWICDHWSTDHPGLHFEPPRLNFDRPWPSTAIFEPSMLLIFGFNANTDPNPASKNNADQYGSGSATLFLSIVRYWASYFITITLQCRSENRSWKSNGNLKKSSLGTSLHGSQSSIPGESRHSGTVYSTLDTELIAYGTFLIIILYLELIRIRM